MSFCSGSCSTFALDLLGSCSGVARQCSGVLGRRSAVSSSIETLSSDVRDFVEQPSDARASVEHLWVPRPEGVPSNC